MSEAAVDEMKDVRAPKAIRRKQRPQFSLNRLENDVFVLSLQPGVARDVAAGEIFGEGIEIRFDKAYEDDDGKTRGHFTITASAGVRIERDEETRRPQGISVEKELRAVEGEFEEFMVTPATAREIGELIGRIQERKSKLVGLEGVLFVDEKLGRDRGHQHENHPMHPDHRRRQREHAELKRQIALLNGQVHRLSAIQHSRMQELKPQLNALFAEAFLQLAKERLEPEQYKNLAIEAKSRSDLKREQLLDGEIHVEH